MDDSLKTIQAVALRLLAGREHSRHELLQKLTAKGFPPDPVLFVIDQLSAEGWQDDFRYAETYARSRIRKGYGPLRIAYELRQQGVNISGRPDSRNLAPIDLEQIVKEEAGSWLSLMEQIYIKKFGDGTHLDYKTWGKRNRFYLQRGFPGTLISALSEHLNIIVI